MTRSSSLKVILKSKSKVTQRRQGEEEKTRIRNVVKKYLLYKLNCRRHNRRPLELKYLHIAKAKRLTYRQVREVVTELEMLGIIETFVATYPQDGTFQRRKFYRTVAKKEVMR